MATESTDKDKRKDLIVGIVYLVLFVLFFEMLFLPYTSLLAGGGAEDTSNLSKFVFYGVTGVIAILVFIGIKLGRIFVKNKKWLPWFDIWVHDPEHSIWARFKNVGPGRFFYNVNKNIILLVLGALLVFTPLLFFGAFIQQTAQPSSFINTFFPQTSFPGSSVFTEQQVTETADFSLAVWPASPSETLFQLGIFNIVLLLAGYFVFVKSILPKEAYTMTKWFIAPFLAALSHLGDHLFRYGGNEVALGSVFAFGLVTSYLYVMSASLVLAINYHEITNAVFKLFQNGILGTDASIGYLIIFEVILLVAFVLSYRASQKASGKSATSSAIT